MKRQLAPAAALLGVLLALPLTAGAENLVTNSGFEDGTTGWSGGEAVTDDPHEGTACLRVVDDDDAGSIVACTEDIIPVTGGGPWVFEAWIRAEVAGQEIMVTINQYDALDEWISGNNKDYVRAAGTEWEEMRHIIRSFHDDAAGVRICLRPVRWTDDGGLTGSAWFDDIVFEQVNEEDLLFGDWIVPAGDIKVWQSPVEQKVRRDIVLPAGDAAPEALLWAARGETEPLQLVLVPDMADAVTDVILPELIGPGGESISASFLTVREVVYIEVTEQTDDSSYLGWVPDPLPVAGFPLALTAGAQQPLWLTVNVPGDAVGGDYTGEVILQLRDAGDITVPVRLHVWDFTMTKEHHLQTAYGMSLNNVDRYHNLGSDPEKRRQVFRLYLEDFAAHRISPYNPFGDDMYTIFFPSWNWHSGVIVVDPENPEGTNHVLKVDDDSTERCVSAHGSTAVTIRRDTRYTLSWRARTSAAHDYLVAINQYDAADEWISGSNIDTVREGDTTWVEESTLIIPDRFNEAAVSVRFTLFARPWTSDGGLTGITWFDDMFFGEEGSDVNLIENADFDIPADEIDAACDFSEFDPAAEYALDELGIDSYRMLLPPFAWGSYFGSSPTTLLGYEWGTPEYEEVFTRALHAITDHLHERGWLDKAFAYWFDEPHPEDYEFVIQGMDILERADPRLRRLLTEQADGEAEVMAGHVDIWAPVLNNYGRDWASERQAAGDEVWWYVCTGPRSPYPNNFIDHPGIEHRVRFWMAWQYNIQGSLYWSGTYWTNDNKFEPPGYQDPWTDPMSYYIYEDREIHWGNGDGRLVYPPRDWADGRERIEGPVPSQRWELLREGIEDYEYFWMLREAADELDELGLDPELVSRARDALVVPGSVFTSLTDFSDDPGRMQEHRLVVAALLEQILNLLPADEEEPVEVVEPIEPVDATEAMEPAADAADASDIVSSEDGGTGDEEDGTGDDSGCGCSMVGA